jgi:hypothetical protein
MFYGNFQRSFENKIKKMRKNFSAKQKNDGNRVLKNKFFSEKSSSKITNKKSGSELFF